jgi:hypothetical protein
MGYFTDTKLFYIIFFSFLFQFPFSVSFSITPHSLQPSFHLEFFPSPAKAYIGLPD